MLNHIQYLFKKRLEKFVEILHQIPDDDLWNSFDDSVNSAGVLAQHVAGNLHYYIGVGMGNANYQRNREREFSNTGESRDELIRRINDAGKAVEEAITTLTESKLKASFALEFPYQLTNRAMLVHLLSHLEYHLGQLDYFCKLRSP